MIPTSFQDEDDYSSDIVHFPAFGKEILIIVFSTSQLLFSYPQSFSEALPTLREHLLRAPVYKAGQKSAEEIGGTDILVKLSANGVPKVGAVTPWPNKTVPYVIESRFSKHYSIYDTIKSS